MSANSGDPTTLLARSLASDRVHSGYLLAGDPTRARDAAERFARALVCENSGQKGSGIAACEACNPCQRSAGGASEDAVVIDGTGKRGPLYRHIGDHPDLYWIDRGADSTRVRIGQVRALQHALRLGSHEGGRRAVVIADAEWLNVEAQNALLRLVEEPPERTTIVLVAASAASLLATIRSRCQRVTFPSPRRVALRGDAPEEVQEVTARLDALESARVGDLLAWAEEFRGERAKAAEAVQRLLSLGSAWLHERAVERVEAGRRDVAPALSAFKTLSACRRDLAQRNANPQMVAERALFGLREAAAR